MNEISGNSTKLILMPNTFNGELCEHAYKICHFCEKQVELSMTNQINQRLSGAENFYCQFCLRHNHNTKNCKHIFVLSFRSILGYYFNNYYKHNKMWLSEIKDYEFVHFKTGEQNPLFSYDPETSLWFIDFAKVGRSKKKIKVTEVLKTILNILTCFNLSQEIPECNPYCFFAKYKKAVLNFYTRRYRPKGHKIFLPTLINCGLNNIKQINDSRYFVLEKYLLQV